MSPCPKNSSNVQMSNVHDQEVKSVENHVNIITKRDYNIAKNIRIHCCKTSHQKSLFSRQSH